MLKQSRGIVYMAIGKEFVEEAIFSAKSFRKHMNWPITIFTNIPETAAEGKIFDEIITIHQTGRRPHRDKLVSMLQSPYDETLFLDTDVYIGASLDDCWEILKYFDMAVSGDRRYKDFIPSGTEVPQSFKEVNLGVVFLKKSEKTIETLKATLKVYDELSAKHPNNRIYSCDQPAFRIASFYSGISIAPLAEEDNCRFATYGKLNGNVRVLHGRFNNKNRTEKNMELLLKKLNHSAAPRTIVAGKMWMLLPTKIPIIQYKAKLKRFNRISVTEIGREVVYKLIRKFFKF
jgi:hypothetical protein